MYGRRLVPGRPKTKFSPKTVKIMSERNVIVHLKIEAILDTMDDVCIHEKDVERKTQQELGYKCRRYIADYYTDSATT